LLELLERHAKLPQDLEEERRTDLAPAVNWNRHGSAVRMVPAFVTSGLPVLDETELARYSPEVAR
jgi:hypothetical protein